MPARSLYEESLRYSKSCMLMHAPLNNLGGLWPTPEICLRPLAI